MRGVALAGESLTCIAAFKPDRTRFSLREGVLASRLDIDCIRVVDSAQFVYKLDADSIFFIDRPALVVVRMRTRSLFIALALAWHIVHAAVARADEPAMVDPFLKAAQTAEIIPSGEEFADEPTFDSALDCTDRVECGDEIGMARLIEPDSRRRGGWVVLTELPVLLPSYSTSTISTANEHPVIGPRTSLGWESDRGFGIRGRFWGFDTAVDMEDSYAPSQQSLYYYQLLDISNHQVNFSGGKFDLDFYKRIELRQGHCLLGASITSAQLKLEETLTVTESTYYRGFYDYDYFDLYNPRSYAYTYDTDSLIRNRGVGLGVLAEGSHRFYETPMHAWSIFGRGRVAYLIGEWEQPNSTVLEQGDGNMAIGEAALGIEYRRKFNRIDLLVQCAFEVQSWDVSRVGRVNFAGVTPGIGLNW